MKTITRLFSTVFCLLFMLFLTSAQAANVPSASLAKVLQKAMPAIVSIRVAVKPNPFLQMQQQKAHPGSPPLKLGRIGSGVIINAAKGYIVTNAHVVNEAKTIEILLKDGRQFTAKLVGADTDADVAVIQIKAHGLTQLPIANSDKLTVGDFVAAIGSPFGLNQTVTSGIISALQRSNVNKSSLDDFIQTDAPINPGNSGGALISYEGQFVGMNTAIITPDGGNAGIGFAIPSNVVLSLAEQLIQHGNVVRGMVGVMAQDLQPSLASAMNIRVKKGALVASVNKNSPAEEAGIKVGDVITEVNRQKISDAGELVSKMGLERAGSKVEVTVMRNNQAKKLTVIVAPPQQIKDVSDQRNPYLNSIVLKNFADLDPVQGEVKGVQVLRVADDSNAYRAGLQPGDVITSVDMKPVDSIDSLQRLLEGLAVQKPLVLNVVRHSSGFFMVLKPAEPEAPLKGK